MLDVGAVSAAAAEAVVAVRLKVPLDTTELGLATKPGVPEPA